MLTRGRSGRYLKSTKEVPRYNAHYSLLTTFNTLLATHHSLLATHHSLLTKDRVRTEALARDVNESLLLSELEHAERRGEAGEVRCGRGAECRWFEVGYGGVGWCVGDNWVMWGKVGWGSDGEGAGGVGVAWGGGVTLGWRGALWRWVRGWGGMGWCGIEWAGTGRGGAGVGFEWCALCN